MASPPAAPVSSASQPQTARRSDRRRLAFSVTLACFGVAVAFLIGEIVVRLAGLAPANFYTYDAHLGWAMEPGAGGWQEEEGRAYLQVNRDGFRGPRLSICEQKMKNEFALVAASRDYYQKVVDPVGGVHIVPSAVWRFPPYARGASEGKNSIT